MLFPMFDIAIDITPKAIAVWCVGCHEPNTLLKPYSAIIKAAIEITRHTFAADK